MKPDILEKFWQQAKSLKNQNELLNFVKQLPSCETRDRLLLDIEITIGLPQEVNTKYDNFMFLTDIEISKEISYLTQKLNSLYDQENLRIDAGIWTIDQDE